ncbi:MAG: glycosyl transferase family 36, partial [Firmicutes bacterium]|nr:glycosyl transferase family 36 [Bacillota bacterium]
RLITGHEYLNRLGLAFDLVFLNESAAGYRQDLQETLRRAVDHRLGSHGPAAGGIFIINAGQLPDEDKTLLMAASRLILQADGPSLRAQLKLAPHKTYTAPPATAEIIAESDRPPAVEMPELLFFNGWGGFTPDGREYRIVLKNGNHLPAPWINVLANDSFGCLVTELGTGYTWWSNSRECKLTPWSNDPVLDPPGEICLLRDEASGAFWSPVPLTFARETHYTVTHGFGYTRFNHARFGIETIMTVFVPLKDPVKIITLQLHNHTDEEKLLAVTYYAEWVLGVRRQESAPYLVTEWLEADRMLVVRNMAQEFFRTATAFLALCPPPASPLSWTADRREFFGRNGTWEHPAAMLQQQLSGKTGALADTCGVVQAGLMLPSRSAETVIILLGCTDSSTAAAELVRHYSRAANCMQALADVQSSWDGILNQIQVSTPSREMDILLNGWLLYQTLGCRLRARTGFYQAGGAYGYRDQLQDVLALLHTRPDLARAQILLHAAHQYIEGDVQHWWHEETSRGIRTRFADDLLWLPYTVARYVEHTGDETVLDEVVPYLQSKPLAEDVHERYEPTQYSAASGTVFEHCLRAIERAL